MSESYETNEFESEVLYDFFDEFIKDCAYFRTRRLAITFLVANTSLTYNQASHSDKLRGIIMRFSRITTYAKRNKIIEIYNKRVFKVIRKVK